MAERCPMCDRELERRSVDRCPACETLLTKPDVEWRCIQCHRDYSAADLALAAKTRRDSDVALLKRVEAEMPPEGRILSDAYTLGYNRGLNDCLAAVAHIRAEIEAAGGQA